MIRQLICEGACNPGRAAVDQAVRAFRRDELYTRSVGHVLPLEPPLATRLRTLTSTAHQFVGPQAILSTDGRVMALKHLWKCDTCGTERTYGLVNAL